jgi:CRISPR system Cascade subunit CasA
VNLIHDAWIPVDRQSGPNQRIAPWQITDSDDPVLRLAAPRPDFNGALLQFLIGLLQTTCSPPSEAKWGEWFEQPPSPQELNERFGTLAGAFHLDGDAPRFLQDHTLLLEANPAELAIHGLLMDANETHFNKPGNVNCTCESCTALAVLTLQLNSPEGGRGHYTSVRGGGPLTTLVVLEEDQRSLWRDVWLNVLNSQAFQSLNAEHTDKSPHRIFPWLAPEKFVKSATKQDTYPVDINGAQIFWGMPRRIYLKEPVPTHQCDICGEKVTSGHAGYFTRPAGISYSNEPVWRHPLSPRYPTDKTGNSLAFRHPRAGGITYDLWPSLVLDGYEHFEIAEVIRHFLAHRRLKDRAFTKSCG